MLPLSKRSVESFHSYIAGARVLDLLAQNTQTFSLSPLLNGSML
jgi:hypothetical protein